MLRHLFKARAAFTTSAIAVNDPQETLAGKEKPPEGGSFYKPEAQLLLNPNLVIARACVVMRHI